MDKPEKQIKNIEQQAKRLQTVPFSKEHILEVNPMDLATIILALFFITLSLVLMPFTYINAVIFVGIGLLIATMFHYRWLQLAIVALTVFYFLEIFFVGYYLDIWEIALFIFTVNVISIGVTWVGISLVIISGILGFTAGIFEKKKYLGIALIISALICAVVDFSVMLIMGYAIDYTLYITGIHLLFYLVAMTITFTIFFAIGSLGNGISKNLDIADRSDGIAFWNHLSSTSWISILTGSVIAIAIGVAIYMYSIFSFLLTDIIAIICIILIIAGTGTALFEIIFYNKLLKY